MTSTHARKELIWKDQKRREVLFLSELFSYTDIGLTVKASKCSPLNMNAKETHLWNTYLPGMIEIRTLVDQKV